MMRPTPALPTEHPIQRVTRHDGVYEGDAAPGDVCFAVFLNGKRVIRLEIAQEFYDEWWFRVLERFVRRYAGSALKLVD